jgi:hypothetical protein
VRSFEIFVGGVDFGFDRLKGIEGVQAIATAGCKVKGADAWVIDLQFSVGCRSM